MINNICIHIRPKFKNHLSNDLFLLIGFFVTAAHRVWCAVSCSSWWASGGIQWAHPAEWLTARGDRVTNCSICALGLILGSSYVVELLEYFREF